MAIAPLIVQTPRVSLIGGKELPKASIADVRVPDITRPFEMLAADMKAKADENQALTSKIEGTRYWEQERDAARQAGIGADGLYKQLKPVPMGDRYFQASYFEARAQSAASELNNTMGDNFNRIQSDFTVPSAERVRRMHAYKDGVVQ